LVDEELKLNKEIENELKDRFKRKADLEKQERNKLLNKWRVNFAFFNHIF
jgi:poly(A) polymerase Pap1